MKNLEKKIAKLDAEQKDLNAQLLATTDASEALKLHHELEEATDQLSQCESRWLELSEES